MGFDSPEGHFLVENLMGGSANFCVQYSDGTRDSYSPYNKGMAIIPTNAQLLLLPPASRDHVVRKLVASQKKVYKELDESAVHLVPEWYGLIFLDLSKSLIWSCQGQNDNMAWKHNAITGDYLSEHPLGGDDNYLLENLSMLARHGLLHKFSSYHGINEKISESEFRHDINSPATNRSSLVSYKVFPTGWTILNGSSWTDNYEFFTENYNLSQQEMDDWEEYIEHHA